MLCVGNGRIYQNIHWHKRFNLWFIFFSVLCQGCIRYFNIKSWLNYSLQINHLMNLAPFLPSMWITHNTLLQMALFVSFHCIIYLNQFQPVRGLQAVYLDYLLVVACDWSPPKSHAIVAAPWMDDWHFFKQENKQRWMVNALAQAQTPLYTCDVGIYMQNNISPSIWANNHGGLWIVNSKCYNLSYCFCSIWRHCYCVYIYTK